ncbi:MAG: co-chaperone GroES [Candidatus Bipolaricaulia bacterium]
MAQKTKTTVKPLGDRVLVKQVELATEAEGGIVLPEGVGDKDYRQAEVLAVGTGKTIEVKEGDIVILSGYSGTEIEVDGEELILVKHNDILAVVD